MLPSPSRLSLCLLLACAARAADPTLPLPSWLSVDAEIRGRYEAPRDIRFIPGNDDDYYLHRLRLSIAVQPVSWLKLFVQGQDSRAPGYDPPVPTNTADPADLHQAYLELGDVDKGRLGLRVGRQEMSFGEERLLGASNWSNVGRSFDGVRLSWHPSGVRLDGFTSSLVVVDEGKFDRPRFNNKFHGVHASFDRLIPKSVWQTYLYLKTNSLVRSERGVAGNGRVYTVGARGAGKLPRRFDYSLETAAQFGHLSIDTVRAWAAHAQMGYSLRPGDQLPRLVAEYNRASGDRNPSDGRRGTFDQLFATNHTKYGIADIVGWRNMHDAMQGLEWRFRPKWRTNLDFHSFWLATQADWLYGDTGTAVLRNPNATSRFLGREIDLQLFFRPSIHVQLVGGAARVFPGAYLEQSSKGAAFSTSYLMLLYRL